MTVLLANELLKTRLLTDMSKEPKFWSQDIGSGLTNETQG
jgi:hypothetical protein